MMHNQPPSYSHYPSRTLYRYMHALEHGDLDTIAAILYEAEHDRDLERMVLEVNEMYQADDNTVVQPAEMAQAIDLLPSDFSASTSGVLERPTRTTGRVRRFSALIQTLAAVLIVGLLIGGYVVLATTHHFSPGSQNPSLPMVAVTTQNGVYALNPANGNVFWDYVSPDTSSLTSVVTLQNGMAYFATQDGQIYALQQSDGSLLWHTDLHIAQPGGNSNLNIVYDAGVVFAGLADGNNGSVVYALQAGNGRVLWKSQKNSQLLAASNGIVYIASRTDVQVNSKLEALRGQNGQLIWSYDTPPLSAIVENNVLFVFSVQKFVPSDFGGNKQYKSLTAFNAQNGKLLWWRQIIDNNVDPMLLEHNLILLGSLYNVNAYHICAYRVSDGSQVWCVPSKNIPFPGNASPSKQNTKTYATPFNQNITSYAADNSMLYVSYPAQISSNGNNASVEVEAFNINNGKLIWSKRFANTGNPGLMTVLNGTAFTTIDNTIYALSANNGSELWNTRVSLDPPIELVASS
jgi:outer membrane protein assembly factor BamB